MAGESYTTKKILLKAVDGTTTQYFIPYVNNATADKTGLVKPDGTTITVDANGTISAQVDTSGLQSKIDADHKLSADLISDGTTNKVVTATEKSTWNGKQDVISDLSTIRANATAGAEAASTIAGYGDIVTHDADEFLTEHQDISGKQDKITSTNKLSADLISEGTTNKLVSALEKSTWNNKQDAILDLDTIRSNATAGAGAASTIAGYGDVVTHDAGEFAEATHTHTKSQITDFPAIPAVNDAEIEIQKNGTKVGSFTTNQGGSKKTINITVPTSAADVSALPASTKYGSTIDLAVDPDTYVVTATLKDQDGAALSSDTIDLPLESVVVSGSYDNTNKKVILTLQSGSTVEFSVADLVSGLQTEITSTNKLSADLIKDGTTNKTVTATEKSTWNSKQDAINDLSTIRSNAEAGANAATTISSYGDIVTHNADEFAEAEHAHVISDITNLQTTLDGKQATISDLSTIRANATAGANAASTIAGYGDIVTHDASEFLTEHQDISGKQDKITSTNKLDADLLVDGVTNKVVTATEKATWNAKQEAISDLSTIRSNATAGAEAASTISGYGDIVTHNADEFLTEHQDISGKQDKIDDLATIRSGAAAGATAVQPDDLATVATSGSYNDLADKPTIPSAVTVDSALSSTSTNPVQNKVINTALGGKQDTISDLSTIRSNAEAGAGAATTIAGYGDIVTHNADEFLTEHQDISGKANIADLATVATSGSYADLLNKPTIPTVNDAEIEIQKNGTKVDSFTANQATAKTINITVPTTAADVSALPASTKYGYAFDLSIDPDTYIVSLTMKDQNGTAIGTTQTIDLPLESVVVNGSYDKTNKKIVLTLQSGSTVDVPVGDLIAGLQTQITSTNKLSADLLADGTTNKVVTATEKNTWNNKQAAISDLATIRSGAGKGATAVQPGDLAKVATSGSYTDLTNKPTIPTVTDTYSATSTNAMSGKAVASAISNKMDKVTLAKVATSGSYNDLTNKPTIPSAVTETTVSGWGFTKNAGTITGIKMNGASKGTSGVVDLGTVLTTPGTGLSLSGATLNHASSITAGTAGTKSATSGATLAVPYVTYNASGHVTAAGTHTHTITGFRENDFSRVALNQCNATNKYLKLATFKGNAASGNQDVSAVFSMDIIGAANEARAFGLIALSARWSSTGFTGIKFEIIYSYGAKKAWFVSNLKAAYKYTAGNSTGMVIELWLENGSTSYVTTYLRPVSLAYGDYGMSEGINGANWTYVNVAGAATSIAATAMTSGYTTLAPTNVGFATISHTQASNTINALTGYTKAKASAAIATTDSLNTAVGKLEYKIDDINTQLQALTAMLNAAS